MKKLTLTLIATSLLALIAACSTFDSRIKENQMVFDKLSPADQHTVRAGFIKVGFTPEMVYMALDKPERKIAGATPGEETWVYHNIYSSTGGGAQQKLVTYTGGVERTGSNAAAPKIGSQPAGQRNTFAVENDPAAEAIKADSMIKVHVKFAEGKVGSIEIIRPH